MSRSLLTRSPRLAALAAAALSAILLTPLGAAGQPNAAPPAAEQGKPPAGEHAKPTAGEGKPVAGDGKPAAGGQAKPAEGKAAEAKPAEAKPAPPKVEMSEALKAVRAKLDAAKADLAQREKELGRQDLTPIDLSRIRDGISPVADQLRTIVSRTEEPLEAARERLTQLGPKPKDVEESPEVIQERAEREAHVTRIDETQRLAKSLLVQTDQIIDRISNRRRASFTRGLFERSQGLLTPTLWTKVAADMPRDLKALQSALSDILLLYGRNGGIGNLLLLGLAFGVSVALYFGRRNIAPRFGRRDAAKVDPTRRQKLLGAWRVILLGTVPAVVGSYAVYYALDATDLLPSRLLPVAGAILGGLAFIAFVEALCDALLSPDKPAWRPAPVSDAGAARVTRLAVGIATVITVVKSIEALNSGISAALPISIGTRGIGALATVLILAIGLHRFADREEEEEACLGPYVPTQTTTGIGGPARLIGWAAVGLIGVAAVIGYVAFAAFLIDQLVWTASLLVLLYLLIQSADTFVGGTLCDDTRFATALQANTGLRKRSLNQIAVLSTGAARVVLILLVALLVLAPWGLDSTDIFSSVRSAFFGFKVGDVTISLSTIALGIGILILGVVITRAIQRWLENTYLPATDLDAGLRNSISTVSGYFGFLLALALAFSYLGLSLEKLTIVAGALSVGIGFGLQSIVNNFVSGLLLLWERPIRVGDQVLIGDSEGIVKRISVRSTEIQTFDRSAVIVPNSNLISGVVKNRVRGDRTGRVTISVGVLRNQDPVRAAELIASCATAHPDVLKEPAPRVVFRKIGDTYLDFELIAMIVDVGLGLKVQTDLNFAVFKTLSDAGLIPPMGPGSSVVTVQGLDGMQNALGEIAGRFGRDGGEGRREGREAPAEAAAAPGEAEPVRSTIPRDLNRRSAGS
jgi:potassium efflux system protein